MDRVRVLRVLEYEGSRDKVEEILRRSIQGQRDFGEVTIKAGTIGDFATVLFGDKPIEERKPDFYEPFASFNNEVIEYFSWYRGITTTDEGDVSELPNAIFDRLSYGELDGRKRRYTSREAAMFDYNKASGNYPQPE